jgi:hypothetical protein
VSLSALRCAVCGGDQVMAVNPGTEPEKALALFTVGRGEPIRGWCHQCWTRQVDRESTDAGPSPGRPR